ncbi:hypothetical protein [Arthrobacter bambusae]|uniref:hypothetical protein n=1 Tax=Arthrobacter bambusae TaxID=1338426 RepID=UPI00278A5077|nr:hypothetical protein [Arthrobacter bambusae]MDQ0241200.1 hypothetical protein [Arthrobacter bambusae]
MIIAGVFVIYAALVLITALPIAYLDSWNDPLGALRYAALIWCAVAIFAGILLFGGAMIYAGVKP